MFATERRIEFVDTDMGGIVHFSRFFVFMETAEHLFLESLGTRVDPVVDGARLGWPRVAVACEYKSPARFGDVLRIEVRVLRRGTRSMTYGFRFARQDGELLAEGRSTSVCCVMEPGGVLRSIPIPPAIAARLAADAG